MPLHDSLHMMRDHSDFIPELAFVLELDGEIVGNIMYIKAWLEDCESNYPTALPVAELVPGALDGKKWMYVPSTAADCCEDVAAVEAFDATFPEKEKKWMPSREEFYIYSHSSVVR